MKELSIEEKAKAYDEALERARKEYEIYKGVKDVFHCEALERIFHKLAESEDEKIRKALINTIKELADEAYVEDGTGGDFWAGDNNSEEIIAWLEKQGESDETKAKVFLINKGYPIDTNGVFPTYEEMYNIIREGLEQQSKQNHADKVEPKFNEGDIIIHKELGGDYIHTPHKIIQVDILDKKYRLEGGLVAHFGEQDDYELVEQTPAWSEEDDEMLDSIIEEVRYIGDFPDYPTKEENELYDECLAKVDWLKSLKARYTWKPSDEQMLVMEYIKNCFDFSKPSYREIFISVYKQLKAL